MWVRTTVFVACGAAVLAATSAAPRAESRLAGVKLYDSGVDVIKRFGSPSDVQPIVFQEVSAGGGGNGGGGGGFAGRPGGSGGAGAAPTQPGDFNFTVPPLSFNQASAAAVDDPGRGGGAAGKFGGGGGGGAGAASMGGGSGGGPNGTTATQYVRWIWKRGTGGSVNVVLNKFNRVVQIEAIGIANKNVRTARGVSLGSSLASVIKAYQNPESYEIGGDYMMVNFLRAHKVAFRFTRESAKSPFRVTAIVVSAGKA